MIFWLVVNLLVALIMAGIGVSNLKSKKPVTISTGEKPFSPKELSDVPAWNKKHGIMWIAYAVLIMLSSLAALFLDLGSALSLILYCVGVILPIPMMLVCHKKLIQIYKIHK